MDRSSPEWGMSYDHEGKEMSIKRILLFGSIALTVIAVTAPAAAQAEVTLTEDTQKLAAGAGVTATSTDLKITTSQGTIVCTKVMLHFEVVTNGPGGHVVLNPLGEGTTEHCTVAENGFRVTITDLTVVQNLTINTWGTGNVGVTLIDHIYHPSDVNHTTPLQTCHFAGTAHLEGRGWGVDEFEITQSALTGTGPGCPPVGAIEGKFTLETSNGTPVELDYEETG
ncbi:MAG TPA: hypothetical protein VNP96_07875 [Solirubrobacterales bacterium]|nr:hypothetical protein [Solirubrobacterales bacterium]